MWHLERMASKVIVVIQASSGELFPSIRWYQPMFLGYTWTTGDVSVERVGIACLGCGKKWSY